MNQHPKQRPCDLSSPTVAYVGWFAGEMEHKLSLNRHKGDREGWINDTPGSLLERLKEEVRELELAIELAHMGGIIAEAADVANFAMMIADIARTLQSVKGPGEFTETEKQCEHQWNYVGFLMTTRYELKGLTELPAFKTVIERCHLCHEERVVKDYPPCFPDARDVEMVNTANAIRPATSLASGPLEQVNKTSFQTFKAAFKHMLKGVVP